MLTVRLAQPSDAPAVQSIFERALRAADWLPAGAEPDTDFVRNSSCETVHVCTTDDGAVRGFIAVYDPGSFVHHLYVDAAFQGQGVGRAILAAVVDSQPNKPWLLKCVLINTRARAFYANTGWRETATAMGSQGPYAVLRKVAALPVALPVARTD